MQKLLFCVVVTILANIATCSNILDGNAILLLEYPLEYNGKLYGNPAISDIGPDGKMYVGLAGNIQNPFTEVPKGIFRYGQDFVPELVVELPELGGFIEKLWFSTDGYLYVAIANYYVPNGIVSNGVIRVDTVSKTFVQIWNSEGVISFPAGLAEDSNGRLYVSDPTLGVIVQLDKSGNVLSILNDTKCHGTNVPVATGCNGIVVISKGSKEYLYTINFDTATILRSKIKNNGCIDEFEEVYQDNSIVTFDQLSADPKQRYLFTAGFATGIVGRISVKNKNKIRVTLLTQTTDGLGFTVQALPVHGFEDTNLEGSLFVNNLNPSVQGSGSIWLLRPECDNPCKCSFY